MLELEEGIEVLKKLLLRGQLIAFVGSGISRDSKLPTWDGFLESFVEFCEDVKTQYQHQEPDAINRLLSKTVLIDAKKDLDKRPAHVAMVLKDALFKMPDEIKSNIEEDFRDWFYSQFALAEPNKKHFQIVGTNYPYILTTNYDKLLEKAQKTLDTPLATYSVFQKDQIASAVYSRRPAIIHIHGTYNDALFDRVVFTAKDYIEIIKNKYPGSRFVIQALLLQYSTVFFGYGSSDPHLEDLMEEISYFFDFKHGADLPKCYLVVLKDKIKNDGVFERYKNSMRTELIAINDFSEYDTLLWALNSSDPRERKVDTGDI